MFKGCSLDSNTVLSRVAQKNLIKPSVSYVVVTVSCSDMNDICHTYHHATNQHTFVHVCMCVYVLPLSSMWHSRQWTSTCISQYYTSKCMQLCNQSIFSPWCEGVTTFPLCVLFFNPPNTCSMVKNYVPCFQPTVWMKGSVSCQITLTAYTVSSQTINQHWQLCNYCMCGFSEVESRCACGSGMFYPYQSQTNLSTECPI